MVPISFSFRLPSDLQLLTVNKIAGLSSTAAPFETKDRKFLRVDERRVLRSLRNPFSHTRAVLCFPFVLASPFSMAFILEFQNGSQFTSLACQHICRFANSWFAWTQCAMQPPP